MARLVDVIEGKLPAALLAIMVVVLNAEVFARYVMGHSIIWAPEVATVCFIWQVYLAAIGVMRRRRHVRINVLRNLVSGRALAQLDAFAGLFILGVLVMTAWQAWNFVVNTDFSLLPATGLSRRVLADALLIGCIGMTLHALLQLAQALRGVVTGDYSPSSDQPISNDSSAGGRIA